MRRALSFVMVMLLGCGGNEAAQPGASGGEAGLPKTGAAPGQAGVEAQRAAILALVKASGATVELADIERQPLVEAEVVVDDAARTLTATVAISVVNAGPTAVSAIDFVLPIGAVDPTRLRIDSVTVDHEQVSAPQDPARWSVPVALAPGGRTTIRYTLHGALVPVATKVEVDDPTAEALAGLQLPTHVVRVDPLALFGESAGVTIVSGIFPRVTGPGDSARMTLALTVVAPTEVTALATGVETQRTRRGALTATSFAAFSVPEAGIVLTRGHVQQRVEVGGVGLVTSTPPSCSADGHGIAAMARRALEDGEAAWGRAPLSELRIVASQALEGRGVATLPGFVLIAPSDCVREAPALNDDPLGAIVAHHPAQRDALQIAVMAAVHRQWWLGRGADPSARLLLEDGVPVAAALASIEKADGDKAARRARVLGLELPYLDARGRSPLRPLARASVGPEPVLARDPAGAAAGPKASLFVDTLARHLGATLYAEALRPLAKRSTITSPELRRAWLDKAPRPTETEALMARWLDQAHADQDVEAPSLMTLFEYLAVDGLMSAGKGLLVDELAQRPDLMGKGLDLLGQGVSPGMALELIDELTGPKDPELQKWLDVAKGLLGERRQQAIDTLVDELGAEVGIPEAERARLRMMAALALKALGEPVPDEDVPELKLEPTDP